MRLTRYVSLLPLVLFSLMSAFGQSHEAPNHIPCRVNDQGDDLFLMSLGNVTTEIAHGWFDARNDEVVLNDGRRIPNYYRDSVRIRFFRPIDKSRFPLPPSGWCSWYYYYQEVNETEIERNAEWIAANLKDYGTRYVQIDDGWQGTGHGLGENRDWATIDKRFSGGMSTLAARIKQLGLTPGLWLAPHGQSNPQVVSRHPGAFLLSADTSVSRTWEGSYLVDPSTRAGLAYLSDLFTTLVGWGYDYFKIDGQPIVLDEYRSKRSFMRDPSVDADTAYRRTLETIRGAIGADRYLLGCWGVPLDGIGIMNGSRTGGDVVLGWSGFKAALDATMKDYFLHNIAWYCDPDVMLLRPPLTLDQARAWATLQGLTGQALMASDRMPDLSSERVEILRRVLPAVDIRPIDLFPSDRAKHIWDLKVNHLGRSYDVVGVFNFDERKTETRFLSWAELGLPSEDPVHVFDFWNGEYLGAWQKGIAVTVSPTSCRVLALAPDHGHIELISTSRHITQGWVDLVDVASDHSRNSYSGRSRVIRGDPYELRFAFPRGKNFTVRHASAGDLEVRVSNHLGWASVRWLPRETGEVIWEVAFEPADYYHYPVGRPGSLTITPAGIDGVDVSWEDQYYLNAGCQVYLNGVLAGHAPTSVFPIRHLEPDSACLLSVRSVWEDGITGTRESSARFTLRRLLPPEILLSALEPRRATTGWGSVEMNRAVSGKGLSIGGRSYPHGIGTHADSDIEFDVKGIYTTFSATVGMDDGSGSDRGSVEFFVIGDGKELWRSGVMTKKHGGSEVSVDITNIGKLLLRVLRVGEGIDYDHADWADARLSRPVVLPAENRHVKK